MRLVLLEQKFVDHERRHSEFMQRTDERFEKSLANDALLLRRQEDARVQLAKWEATRDTVAKIASIVFTVSIAIAGFVGWVLHWFWPTKS